MKTFRFESWLVLGSCLAACVASDPNARTRPAPPVAAREQTSIVELAPVDVAMPQVRRSLAHLRSDSPGPRYGECVVQYAMGITPGFDALLGTHDQDGDWSLYAARVPHGEADDLDAWRFAQGDDRWSSDIDAARPLFSGFDGAVTVFWSAPQQRFLALYGRIDRTGYALVVRAAHEPVGPYGPARVLTRIPWSATSVPSDVRVHADAEVVQGVEGERVLVSVFDPALGKRRLFRITW
jgi:hypothetical protein